MLQESPQAAFVQPYRHAKPEERPLDPPNPANRHPVTTDELFVATPGGPLYVKRWQPEAPVSEHPLILLHDSLGCVALWREFPNLLADRLARHVIAYDRLGFGRSGARSDRPANHFIAEEATDQFPLLKRALAFDRYALLGHSVGGGMAVNIAAGDPDCRALVTLSAQAFVEDRTLDGIRAARTQFAQPGEFERLAKWHGDKAGWVLRAWTETWLSPAFADWSLDDCIGRVTCPLLAIHGEHDEYGSAAFPAFIADRSGGIGQALVLEECGHLPHREQPAQVIDAVRAFLQANP